jgi:hypothetical protein
MIDRVFQGASGFAMSLPRGVGRNRPMHTPRPLRTALAIGLILLAAGCATTRRIAAAGDVHALLIAIRDDDRATFDAHVDKAALEHELEGRILARTQAADVSDAGKALGALMARAVSQLAGDALVRPQVFRAVAEYFGYKPDTPIPGQFEIAAALRPLPDGRVCAAKAHDGPCLITFANEAGTWKLVSFDGDMSQLRLK